MLANSKVKQPFKTAVQMFRDDTEKLGRYQALRKDISLAEECCRKYKTVW
jgi:hypothetical protein